MTDDEVEESEARRTVSLVRLEADQWLAVNTDDPTITHHAASLTDLLFAHRHAVAFRLSRPLVVRYLVGDEETADRIERIRAVGAEVAALRRAAKHAEARIRAERVALMRHLADLRVAPSEIAHILAVPRTAVPKDLGVDREVRIVREAAKISPGDASEPLF